MEMGGAPRPRLLRAWLEPEPLGITGFRRGAPVESENDRSGESSFRR